MPRAERPLEHDGSALTDFAADLRKLREEAGSPPYRELAKRAHYSATTLSDAAGGRRLPSLAVTLAFVTACDGDRDEWERRWHRLAADLNDSDGPPEPVGEAPYVGLSAYRSEDAQWFFGRERLVEDLAMRLSTQRFLAVFGPSGAGKSSVLRAGLIPALRSSPDSGAVVLFTPGTHPVRECAIHLAPLVGAMAVAVETELRAAPHALHSLTKQLRIDRPTTAEPVVVVDQFEEVFTLCTDPDERATFLGLLLTAISSESGCRVVLGVRADFYSHCAQHPELAAALQDAQITVGPMTAGELRRAITRPANIAECAVESDLLSALVAHTHGQAGTLPLLSHALLETWRRRKGNTLTLAGFQATGGIDGALARTAEAVYSSLTTRQQDVAQHLLRRLVVLGEGTEDTRRRVRRSELDDTPDTTAVLNAFGGARLLTFGRDDVEITHEALIGAWPRLQRWLNADREGHRLHRELTDAAAVWQNHDQDPATLVRGNRLTLLTDWANDDKGLTELEQAFLQASAAADEAARTSTRRQIRRQRVLIAVLTVLVVLATGAFVYASNAQQTAAQQRETALALRTALASRAVPVAEGLIHTDPRRAAMLALAAYRLNPSQATESPLIGASAALAAIDLKTEFATVSANSEVLVAGHPDTGIVTIFSITDDGLREESSVPFVDGARAGLRPSVSPHGKVLLSPGHNGELVVWDISDIREPVRRATVPATTHVSGWSPDGRYILTTNVLAVPKYVPDISELWDLGDPATPVHTATLPGTWPQFAAGRDLVATIKPMPDGDTVVLHKLLPDGKTYEPRATITTPGMTVRQVAFSHDGRQATLSEFKKERDLEYPHSVSWWRTEWGGSAELLMRAGYTPAEIPVLQVSPDGSRPPTVLTQTLNAITMLDTPEFGPDRSIRGGSADRVLSTTTSGALDIALVHYAHRLNALLLVTNHNGKYEYRRLELSAEKSASNACGRDVERTAAGIWATNFPGVTPFRLCP
ncbi:nSTAND1 domain-containing NTPase [Kibdelosporangium aridum]|uniref:Helix-turn-helix domain-containing protein n=1 Tax=Kibdelosporangium aridum TaxID=2030 RepID=A0A1W2B7P8_KIBAR|nr:helix-turn-helix domain-containing protein [Kibdelosporangium aridum]SMC68820.1 Helix-turn-helix domain-containing protein [Kibdelosporangium aridum]